MGFVTDMKRPQARETLKTAPIHTDTQCFFMVFSSQECQDGVRIKSGSNGAKGTCTRQEHRRDRKRGRCEVR